MDVGCLASKSPVNDLVSLQGWEIAVVTVCGAVFLTLLGFLLWYLTILVKREQQAQMQFDGI